MLSEKYFEQLAKENPNELIRLLTTEDISIGLLARGLKSFALCSDHNLASSFLISYLDHSQPMIQEGALIGLEAHKTQTAIDSVINLKPKNDIIKDMVSEFLIDFQDI